MNLLIVYAHPEPRSFNGALKNVAMHTLASAGHDVRLSDLYAMAWSPALGEQDFAGERVDADYLDLSREQEHAFAEGSLCEAIRAEQAKVEWADVLIFQFPIWWFSMPAILKGWVDRVFSRGFAYSAGRKYESGHFKGKRAMLSITTGTASTLYEPNGIDGDLLHVLWPIHNGILAYTGFSVLPPFVAWMPAKASPVAREAYLDEYAQRLRSLDRAEPLFFHPWRDYDDTQRLKPDVRARSGVQWNPRAGQTFETAATGWLSSPGETASGGTSGDRQRDGSRFAYQTFCLESYMKGYWIIFGSEVTDQDAQKQYSALWTPIAEKYQAKVKALDAASALKETHGSRRVLVVEFPSLEAAKACYDDSAYQEAKSFAVRASKRELVIVEGDIA